MKIKNILISLIAILVVQSCGSTYKIPSYIQEKQKAFEGREQRSLNGDDVFLSPIEVIPDTTNRFLAQSTGNWGYNYLEVDKWAEAIKAKAKRKVVVFVFDTGGEYDHPNLKPFTDNGKSFTGEPLIDLHGHSTHCMGTILGASNGSAKVGIAEPLREVGLIEGRPYKVLRNSGSGSYTQIRSGISDANEVAKDLIAQGDFVIYSFSLGGSIGNAGVDAELKNAKGLGVLISMAANGNNGQPKNSFPGASDYTEGVGAIQSNGRRAPYSNYGPETTYALPGSGVYSTYKDQGYALLSGTSMATPHAAAVAAILASVNPNATAEEILAHMEKYSTDLGPKGFDNEFGFGVPKLTPLMENPIEGNPAPPDDEEPPTDPDPDPTPPDDEPEQPDGPESTNTFKLPKTYSIVWQNFGTQDRNMLYFSLDVEYTHKLSLSGAAKSIDELTDKFFANRGLVLPPGSTDIDAAYYAAYFYELINKRRGYEVEATDMTLNFGGILIKQEKLPQKVSQDKLNRMGGITYHW